MSFIGVRFNRVDFHIIVDQISYLHPFFPFLFLLIFSTTKRNPKNHFVNKSPNWVLGLFHYLLIKVLDLHNGFGLKLLLMNPEIFRLRERQRISRRRRSKWRQWRRTRRTRTVAAAMGGQGAATTRSRASRRQHRLQLPLITETPKEERASHTEPQWED